MEKIYKRKVQPDKLINQELAKYITTISAEIKRQIGIIISRDGIITHTIIGDANSVFIPSLDNYPIGRKALRGLRFIHTHLKDTPLNSEDITDLALLRFDIIAAISIRNSLPYKIYTAYLNPVESEQKIESLSSDFYGFELNFSNFIDVLERETDRVRIIDPRDSRERAILISASLLSRYELEESMEELKELALSNNIIMLDTVIQRLKEINPKFLLGKGKLKEIIIGAMEKRATILIFDQNLTPSQAMAITEITELKVIDRSQLILDIFARRAHSRDGKVQVELAQLKYTLSMLIGKGTAMSRLTGGIGGRGPGEMKLETDRRKIRNKIAYLEKELSHLKEARNQRRQRRIKANIPIVSIIGYTNAGKSTLLNFLTKSETFIEDKMFATLDTASRRLRFPKEREIIITDTVGFIKDLPKDLVSAFKSTLEELEDADVLLHLVDISNPHFIQHIESVETILKDLNLIDKKRLMVFNKSEKIPISEVNNIISNYPNSIAISAINPSTFKPLLENIELSIWQTKLG